MIALQPPNALVRSRVIYRMSAEGPRQSKAKKKWQEVRTRFLPNTNTAGRDSEIPPIQEPNTQKLMGGETPPLRVRALRETRNLFLNIAKKVEMLFNLC